MFDDDIVVVYLCLVVYMIYMLGLIGMLKVVVVEYGLFVVYCDVFVVVLLIEVGDCLLYFVLVNFDVVYECWFVLFVVGVGIVVVLL